MTDIALDRAPEAPAHAPLFSRRLHAFVRLLNTRRPAASAASALHFADDRMLADVGLRRDRHRDDWLTAFLSR